MTSRRRRAPADDEEGARQREGRVKGIFEDLLNLEINVIVTPGMTARKMPNAWQAFAETARSYTDLLDDFVTEVSAVLSSRQWAPIAVLEPEEARASRTSLGDLSMVDEQGRLRRLPAIGKLVRPDTPPSVEVFRTLGTRARESWAVACTLVATPGWPDRDKVNERVVLLKRIYRNCQQLENILRPQPHEAVMDDSILERDVALDPEDLITLRKIWEVGIATVVMQTVVQLDGDIVTRVHAAHAATASKAIHDLHRESVGSAMQNWQFLGQTLAQLVGSFKNLL